MRIAAQLMQSSMAFAFKRWGDLVAAQVRQTAIQRCSRMCGHGPIASVPLTAARSLARFLTLSRSLAPSLSHSLSLCRSLSLSLSLSLSRALSLAQKRERAGSQLSALQEKAALRIAASLLQSTTAYAFKQWSR
eukprot:SAG22_NODE_277_length_13166_cov_134.125277_2_plen_134_part_00